MITCKPCPSPADCRFLRCSSRSLPRPFHHPRPATVMPRVDRRITSWPIDIRTGVAGFSRSNSYPRSTRTGYIRHQEILLHPPTLGGLGKRLLQQQAQPEGPECLCTLYECFIRTLGPQVSNQMRPVPPTHWQAQNASGETGMAGMWAVAVLCILSVIFYSWFLVVLCKDCKRRWVAYLVRVEPGADEQQAADRPDINKTVVRAA
jgi:hypothetical protein